MSYRLLTSVGLGALLLSALAPSTGSAAPLAEPPVFTSQHGVLDLVMVAGAVPTAITDSVTHQRLGLYGLPAHCPTAECLPCRQRPSAGRRAAAAHPRRHAEDPPGQQSAADHRRRASRRQSGAGRQPDQPAHARPHRRAASCGRAERPVRRLRLPRTAQSRQHRRRILHADQSYRPRHGSSRHGCGLRCRRLCNPDPGQPPVRPFLVPSAPSRHRPEPGDRRACRASSPSARPRTCAPTRPASPRCVPATFVT